MTKHLKSQFACAITLLLSACLLSPGKFTSSLDLRRDGHFSFAYKGAIYTLALSKLADMGRAKTFEPSNCYDDNMKKRSCTSTELADQKKDWDSGQSDREAKDKRDAEMFKAMFGGIDPSNPKAAEDLAMRLRRQVGWRSVVYKGDGLFEVDFAITGTLDHDFAFPTIERFPTANSFVTLNRRVDGTVRIDAPGFTPSAGGAPLSQLMALGASGAAMMGGKNGEKDKAPPMPSLDGTFTITTDGTVLANNTDEGPQPDPAGQKLSWVVNPRTSAAPTALIKQSK